MLYGRRPLAGDSRPPGAWLAVVFLAVLLAGSGLISLAGTAPAAPAPGMSSSPAAAVLPAQGTPQGPFIFDFSASPTYLYPGNTTVLSVFAIGNGSDVLNYNYFGLPGCPSENTSELVCDALFPGNFSITVDVTDTNASNGQSAFDSVSITVLWGYAITGEGQFFSVNPSVLSNLDDSDAACTSVASPPFYQNYCYPQAQDPTLLNLPHGRVGLVSQMYTNLTSDTCSNAAKATVARVGFALSTDGGASFAPAVTLGNDTCSYLNSIEPSFTAVGSDIYGVFIEEDSSLLAANYINRSGDAIGFVKSTDSGATWSAVRTIQTGHPFARPSIGAEGANLYVAYDRLTNSTHAIAGGVLPISVNLLYSANSGGTFAGPYVLPGLNATADFNAMSPAVAVNSTGSVAVGYATDRSCLTPGPSSSCYEYGDSVVVATSSTHGSTWVGPVTVGRDAGETDCYSGTCLPGFFESTPQIAIAYSTSGSHLYVAYSAVYSQGGGVPLTPSSPTGIFADESANGGATWTTHTIVAPPGQTLVRSFDPGLAVSTHEVAVTYLQMNATDGVYGFANSLSQWWDSTPTGTTMSWAPPNALNIDSFVQTGGAVNSTRSSYAGDASAVVFNATTSEPIVAFAIPLSPTVTISHGVGYYYTNTTYETDIAVGVGLSNNAPGTVAVLFYQTGIASGLNWQFTLNGISYTTNQVGVYFDDLPAGANLIVGANFQTSFWEIVTTNFNATVQSFYFNESDGFNFQIWVGLEFYQFPGGLGPWLTEFEGFEDVSAQLLASPFPTYVETDWIDEGTFNFINFTIYPESEISYFSPAANYDLQCLYYQCGYPTPWYFPLGSTVELDFEQTAYMQLPPIYWSGVGNGNYTGQVLGFCDFGCFLQSGPITMDGPINETAWLGDSPENLSSNVTVSASGLPASSQYAFSIDGTPYSASATSPVLVSDVAAGAHSISRVSATSTRSGYEYFGQAAGPNPFVTPIETAVQLNFTSLVDVAKPPGQVAFHAPALSTGTTWSIVVNGTSYSSSTPWIYVTTRNGTYEWSPGDASNPGGTTGYTPTTPGGNITLTTGRTVTVSYSTANELEVLSGVGGTVAVGGGSPTNEQTLWTSPGQPVSLTPVTTPGYIFTGWSGTGAGSYNGSTVSPTLTVNGPVVETASFAPLPSARFNLTFAAEGLPTGTWWTVDLGGTDYSTNLSRLTVTNLWPWASGATGQYSLSVPDVYLNSTNLTRFVPAVYPSVVGTNGTATPIVVLTFGPRVLVQASGSSGGTVELTYDGSPAGTSVWIPLGSGVEASAVPQPGYTFDGWVGTGSGAYTGPLPSVAFNATGPVSEVATFSPVSPPSLLRYTVTFSLTTPIAPGTEWSVTFGGQGYSSTGATLTVPDVNGGTYGIQLNPATAPDGLTQYRATATDPVAYTVTGDATVSVAYSNYYWVAVSGSVGGSTQPFSGWYAAGSILYLVASPNATYSFTSWTGSGPGNYTGTNGTAAVIVNSPITEVATFSPSSGAAAAGSIWQDPATWVGLGASGLIVGILAGVVGARWFARPASRPSRPSGPPTTGTAGRGGSG